MYGYVSPTTSTHFHSTIALSIAIAAALTNPDTGTVTNHAKAIFLWKIEQIITLIKSVQVAAWLFALAVHTVIILGVIMEI